MAPKRRVKNAKFNKLLPQEFACSDLPKSFFKNFFSCSACDDWRIRLVHGRRNKTSSQAELRSERMRCQRSKRGMKPIRFRVIVGGEASNVLCRPSAEVSEVVAEEPVATVLMTKQATEKALLNEKKDKEALAVRERLVREMKKKKAVAKASKDDVIVSKATEAFKRNIILKLTTNLRQALVEKNKCLALEAHVKSEQMRRMKAEDALREEKLVTKKLRDQVMYYKKCLALVLEKKNVAVTMHAGDKTSLDCLVERIEDAFGIMKGAHAATKAAKLLELISTGLLFTGQGPSMLESMHRDFVKNTFSPWKLVYASDMSPAGSFRTATVLGLTEFFDPLEEEDGSRKQRMFPSSSTVSRERLALNKYAKERIGFERKESPYGEIYYINPKKAIRLLLEASGLTKYAQEGPVHIAVTSDGANTFHNRTQISIGIKIVDTRGHHCKTKMPLFVSEVGNDVEDEGGSFKGVQSSEMCTICVMADARDKAKMYAEVFADFYK